MASYSVPARRVRCEQLFGNSRFLATGGRASSAEEAQTFIREIREEMPDATHHVYAFRAGHGSSVVEGMSDDGEPSGTSGPPILSVLRGSDIGDIVVVVTRYFGGKKLGTGGLVTAYSESAKALLAAMPLEKKVDRERIGVRIHYMHYDAVSRCLAEAGAVIVEEEFGEDVHILAAAPEESTGALINQITEATAGGAVFDKRVADTTQPRR
jgi:uncharacterized YigZ family protein